MIPTISAIGTICLFILIGAGMYGCPQYNVYNQRMEGEAQLAHAHASRQVQIADAEGKKAAASLLADAEVARAEGVAKANKIIGVSLHDNEAYLRYLFIDKLDTTKGQVIYIPTEAGLPLLEAGRRANIAPIPQSK